MRRVRVLISGDVHNVGFRSWVRNKAEEFSLRGWVRNNTDGTVEAVFEGEDHDVDEILDDCKRGPPGSYVEGVDISEEKSAEKFDGFKQLY